MSRLSLAELHKLCLRALRAHGLREPSARLVAQSLTAAEASGSHSHGVFRLQGYCEALQTGRVDGRAEPVLESPAGAATVLVNAQGSFAPAALDLAVPALAAAAKQHGVAACAVRNTFHFAALWPEAEALAERGLLALATVNSKAFVANASGGPAVFGTNPIAFGCPRGGSLPPLVFDQACSVMARGDVSLAARDGMPLAEGVGLDRAGAPSLDAAAVLDGGVLLPFGAPAAAHKGANLALMVELLAGTLHADTCMCTMYHVLGALTVTPEAVALTLTLTLTLTPTLTLTLTPTPTPTLTLTLTLALALCTREAAPTPVQARSLAALSASRPWRRTRTGSARRAMASGCSIAYIWHIACGVTIPVCARRQALPPTVTGELMLALDPSAFGGDGFLGRVEALCAALQGTEGARLPGARRAECHARAEREGVELPQALYRQAIELGERSLDANTEKGT